MDKTQNNLEKILETVRNEVALENGFSLTMPTYWGFAMLLTRRKKKQLWLYEQVMWKLIQKYYTPNSQIQAELENYFGHILNDGSGKPMRISLEEVADDVINLFRIKKEQNEK